MYKKKKNILIINFKYFLISLKKRKTKSYKNYKKILRKKLINLKEIMFF